jgi:hypothetical protein
MTEEENMLCMQEGGGNTFTSVGSSIIFEGLMGGSISSKRVPFAFDSKSTNTSQVLSGLMTKVYKWDEVSVMG